MKRTLTGWFDAWKVEKCREHKTVQVQPAKKLNFKGRKKKNTIEGKCYQSFALENGDELDIISTNKSVYGYLAVSGEFDVNYQWSSCSVNTKANIGANNGKKIKDGQKIYILNINKNFYIQLNTTKYL